MTISAAPFDPTTPEPYRLRMALGKKTSQAKMAALVGSPSYRTWQAWEAEQPGLRRGMPVGLWELALLKTGHHPNLRLVEV